MGICEEETAMYAFGLERPVLDKIPTSDQARNTSAHLPSGLSSSGVIPTLPTATPMHRTFFNWNFT